MAKCARNGYIDVVKFVFSLIILEFHLNSGIFPGGRLAVEGFFMISSYLMMCYIEKSSTSSHTDSIGISTVRFILRKYKGLFPYLLPSVLLCSLVYALRDGLTISAYLQRFPLLLFELIPLREAGFRGFYVLGISWYISAMFFSLSILFPLCKVLKQNFTLIICPIFALLAYGFLSHTYGHLGIASMFIDGIPISAGLIRALAASALGCFLYELCVIVRGLQPTKSGRIVFTFLELSGFAYFFYVTHALPKSMYDYVIIFVLLALLFIGINGFSFTTYLMIPQYTKFLGTFSSIIVLNHCCWRDYLPTILGNGYQFTEKAYIYYGAVIASSLVVFFLSKLIQKILFCCHSIKLLSLK